MSNTGEGSEDGWGPLICAKGGKGLFFPILESEYDWPVAARISLYGVALLYLFLGVNLVASKFMDAITAITSKQLRVTQDNGRTITVSRWNPTVANITLMALGSSAPEILLSCVEVGKRDFYSGKLGPGTIVGSAAFNLFVIIAVCIFAIPSPEVRQVKEVTVFKITAFFSLIVYIWLVLIVQYISPNVIDIWEGVLTLAFFPCLVFFAYVGDASFDEQRVAYQKAVTNFLGFEDEEVDDVEDVREGAQEDNSDASEEETQERDRQLVNMHDNICDKNGKPLSNPAGVLTFEDDELEVEGSHFSWSCPIMVFRRNSTLGEISCAYRTVALTAMPGYDYEDVEGELLFASDDREAEIPIEILPKKMYKVADQFQLILDSGEGGVVFNPHHDGGLNRAVLTVTILNGRDGVADGDEEDSEDQSNTYWYQLMRALDENMNLDKFYIATMAWIGNISDSVIDVNGNNWDHANKVDWVIFAIFLPWKVLFAVFIPPPEYGDGWFSFCVCIIGIGLLTACILDFAELFGCVVKIKDGITAITLVALGTSMPDLFASKTAAVQDETADASIVNVTGSNSVNVLLGIGLPWTVAALYWKVFGATDLWKDRYPDFVEDYPQGAFVVEGNDITFSVLVYTVFACIAIGILRARRIFYGGELGGPVKIKAFSSFVFVSLWVAYILLSMYDMQYKDQDLSATIGSLVNLENTFFLVGVTINMAYILVCVADIFDTVHG